MTTAIFIFSSSLSLPLHPYPHPESHHALKNSGQYFAKADTGTRRPEGTMPVWVWGISFPHPLSSMLSSGVSHLCVRGDPA